jgi:hypothetical protein
MQDYLLLLLNSIAIVRIWDMQNEFHWLKEFIIYALTLEGLGPNCLDI